MIRTFCYMGLLILSLSCLGCSSGDTEEVISNQVVVDGVGVTQTVNFDDNDTPFDLSINASNSTITIVSDNKVKDITFRGSNTMLTIESNVTVESISISGSDNTIVVPLGSGIVISTDTGVNNTLIEQ